jgi:hypothetical protein
MTDQWVTLQYPETGGRTTVPNTPAAVEGLTARGWEIVEDAPHPDEVVSVPQKLDRDPDADAGLWVDLVHPETGGAARFPNNAAALDGPDGAFAKGWRYVEADEDAVADEVRELRRGKGGRASAAERETAAELAAAKAAETDEPPAPPEASDVDMPAAGDDQGE